MLNKVIPSSLSMAANFVLPLAAIPLLTRALGASDFGEFAMVSAIAMMVAQCIDYGFILSGSRAVAAAASDLSKISKIYSKVQAARLAIAFVVIFVVILVGPWLPVDGMLLTIVLVPTAIGSILQSVWLFQGLANFSILALANLLGRGGYLIGAILVFNGVGGVYLAAASFGLGYLIVGIILVGAARGMGLRFSCRFGFREIAKTMVDAWKSFLSVGLLAFHAQLVLVVVGSVGGAAAAGVLASAEKVVRAATVVFAPLTSVLFPVFSRLYVEDGRRALTLSRRVISFYSFVSIVVSFLIYVTAPQIADLVQPDGAILLAEMIRLMVAVPFFVAIGVVFGGLTLVAAARDSEYLFTIFVAEIVALVTLFFCVRSDAAMAGATSIVVAEMTLAMLMAVFAYLRVWKIVGRDEKL